MADHDELLRRRTASYRRPATVRPDSLQIERYLKKVQDETTVLGATDVPLDLGPAYLRSRAAHYRGLAKQQTDPHRAQLFNDLAASFEKHAVVKEHSPPPRQS